MDVRVTLPYTALLGAHDHPGELAGYGPIPAAVARDLAAGGTWRRILTDPQSGRPLDYGTTRYRPPTHLAGLVTTRDQTCPFDPLPGRLLTTSGTADIVAPALWSARDVAVSKSVTTDPDDLRRLDSHLDVGIV